MTDPELIEVLRRLYEADTFAEGVPAMLERAHPDIEIRPAAVWLDMEQPVHRGHEGVRQYFADLQEAFANLRYELVELADHGDALLAEVLVHVEGRESGAPSTLRGFQVLWVEDGLIRRVEGYLDRDQALAAIAR